MPCRCLSRRRPWRHRRSRLSPPSMAFTAPGAEPMSATQGPVPGPGILDIAPYVGGDAKLPGIERPIRLASNESALGPSPKAVAAYLALAGEIHRYPEGSSEVLRETIG